MTLDRYSKVVLTVIAICLVWVCIRDIPFVRLAQAAPPQYGTQDVRIVDIKPDYLPVRIVEK
jgi:branched-subunit amino acid transport protein AzlD